ncbi:hypothetical protein [Halogeometricum borinquense]|uniref:hypothetical protein n=1 Tax=Halogeometricum borinquense TaxID=60847 RepID=UPI003413ED41
MALTGPIRRPEYTGERRCWPCTVVNVVLLLVITAAIAVLSVPVALVVAISGAALVYLRGYVVPGTPEFAPKLVARLGLSSLFGYVPDEGEERRSDELSEVTNGEDVLLALFERGVLKEDADGALFLSDAFWSAWEAEMATLRDRDDDGVAAAVAAAAPFEAAGGTRFDGITVEGNGQSIWLSRAHAIADAAAVRTLADFEVPESARAPATTALRMFLEVCPRCGGPTAETTTASDCCGSGTVGSFDTPENEVLACTDCGEILYVYDEADERK